MAIKERIMQSLNTYIEIFGLPYDNIKEDTKKMLVNWMDDTLNGRWTSLADMAEMESSTVSGSISSMKSAWENLVEKVLDGRDSMNNYEKIEITFKSGETISYGKGKWDDYAYDGKAVLVKKYGDDGKAVIVKKNGDDGKALIVKKNGAWIGIYNFDEVFCVELK